MWAETSGLAYMEGYLPLNQKELALRFPQHVVRGHFVQDMSARIGKTAISFLEPSNQIRFSGTDLSGKPWAVTADAWRGGGLYSADLDHNGIVDIIYASYTGGNGLAPSMHVLILLLDASGRPVPSEMDGYFKIDGGGVKDLVDLDGNGRAELVRQSYDDGYWITSLYEARDAHWHLVKGPHGGREYPLYTALRTERTGCRRRPHPDAIQLRMISRMLSTATIPPSRSNTWTGQMSNSRGIPSFGFLTDGVVKRSAGMRRR